MEDKTLSMAISQLHMEQGAQTLDYRKLGVNERKWNTLLMLFRHFLFEHLEQTFFEAKAILSDAVEFWLLSLLL